MLVDQDYDAEDEEDTNAETVAIAVQKSIEKVLSERTAFVKVRLHSRLAAPSTAPFRAFNG